METTLVLVLGAIFGVILSGSLVLATLERTYRQTLVGRVDSVSEDLALPVAA
jgi:hypothetical protein